MTTNPNAEFAFHIAQPSGEPLVRVRVFAADADALDYARQLQGDWPDSEFIDVVQAGRLLERLRRRSR